MKTIALRVFLFLIVIFFALRCTLKSREDRWGGKARYENRTANTGAWDSLSTYTKPTSEDMLRFVCRYACKDTSWQKILLPDDNLHHMLASLANPEDGLPSPNPEKIVSELMWAEEGIDLRGKLDRNTTLADVLRMMNALPPP